jgi:WD40 repeat protein
MDVLMCLVDRAGDVVTRQEIIDVVWATEYIADNTLTHCITEIRNALGDDARNSSFIETIHRRGYRLIAPVEPALSDDAGESRVARFPIPERQEKRSPYPGLAAFTEDDAEFFFGREAEVARMWRKLTSRRLLAVIGPSGVGKSSFLQAGVIPAKPEGWGVLVCQPGQAPFAALARALLPEFAGDDEAISKLVHLTEPEEIVAMVSRWRDRHDQVLLIVDQFEELFTLNPTDVQDRFAALLRLLVDQADILLLLSLRDDFLYQCQSFDPLHPMLDGLFALRQPDSDSLKRILVEPAGQFDFNFEDERLVSEMIAEVEGERGALPLLAFAVARLWDERDRDNRTLTRQAYIDNGGVGGALARHAESTLQSIGDARRPIVREIFRNLVTSQGTRAVRTWDELLSVFEQRETNVEAASTPARNDAEEVLHRLIDARLLTSFEEKEALGPGRRRVEIVHESLLANWPRLVRWQTQDVDAAQFRDQLRQAARTWDEHDRTRDYLWTGRAFREYALWRENYPGGLSDLEKTFASEIASHAKKRKRLRRIAAVAVITMAAMVAGVTTLLWRRSVEGARRAEAAKLLALAQLQLDTDPTEALAYATSSLQLADTREARLFALRALSEGPPARVLIEGRKRVKVPSFSPDGKWLAAGGHSEELMVWPESGGIPKWLPGHIDSTQGPNRAMWTSSGFLVTGHSTLQTVRVWSIADEKVVRTIEFDQPAFWRVAETHLVAEVGPNVFSDAPGVIHLQRWRIPDGELEELGSVDFDTLDATNSFFSADGRGWVYAKGNTIYYRPLPIRSGARDITLGRHVNDAYLLPPRIDEPDRIWSVDTMTSEYRCWSLSNHDLNPVRVVTPPPEPGTSFATRYGAEQWLFRSFFGKEGVQVEDLGWLPESRPMRLRRKGNWAYSTRDLHPGGRWLVSSINNSSELVFWPLVMPLPSIVEGFVDTGARPVVFSPDGRWLATTWDNQSLRLWPVAQGGDVQKLSWDPTGLVVTLVFDPSGQRLLTVGFGDDFFLLTLEGTSSKRIKASKRLEGFSINHYLHAAAFSPSGRLVAAGTGQSGTEKKVLRIWDLEKNEDREFPLKPSQSNEVSTGESPEEPDYGVDAIAFLDESTLMIAGWDGVRKWDLETGASTVVVPRQPGTRTQFTLTADRMRMIVKSVDSSVQPWISTFSMLDLASGLSRPLHGFGDRVDAGTQSAIDPNGTILATGDQEGIVRVGRIDGGEPHMLLGHEGAIASVAISPDLGWIASAGFGDETLRLWPMPDLSKPPLHTLPREELIAKLKTLTNLRVVRNEESATGWKVEVGPFPGWETVPTW